ncbi:hypothetical protein PTTG_10801, partial [Puccinia triticina 1-1 BBBD Race 1]|uniref:Uncharacterized protein n=1 Tax=Puccinia triticina (isolate 1-1 / race 1 (BBBD)) TaxID=630390 RepID=A0A0C4FC49_PUCT1
PRKPEQHQSHGRQSQSTTPQGRSTCNHNPRRKSSATASQRRAGLAAPVAVPIVPPMAPEQQQGSLPNPAGAPAKGPKVGVPENFDGTRGAKAEFYVTLWSSVHC